MDNQNLTTCGPLFETCWREIESKVAGTHLLFEAGFVVGQAEKIYLGACHAAMFRPTDNRSKNVVLTSCMVCSAVYGLQVSIFEREEIKDEIWLVDNRFANHLADVLCNYSYNSQEWHIERGLLCGIPLANIDPSFHERKGFNEKIEIDSSTEWELNRESLG